MMGGGRARAAALCAAVVVAVGCGSDGGGAGGNVESDPFGPPSPAARWTFQRNAPDGSMETVESRRVGTREVDGVPYDAWRAGNFGATAPDGGEAWIDWDPEGEAVVAAGGELWWGSGMIVPAGEPLATGTFDTPVAIDLLPPVGEPQTVPVGVLVTVGAPASGRDPVRIDTTLTYTLVETDVTVDTAGGPVPGCRRFEGSAEVLGERHDGTVWYHPDIGLVKGDLDWPPPNGSHMDFTALMDPGVPADGWNLMKGVGLITPAQRTFRLDTHDVNGAFDADKDTHAQMLLEVRWADPDKARTEPLPSLFAPDFGTVWGTYPATWVTSTVSIFHPEENGQGFTYGYAFVDQAAKNEPENGIAYHAAVTLPDFVSSPMRVTGRLRYRLYQP